MSALTADEHTSSNRILGIAVVVIKILTAFYSVPANKAALGITSWVEPEVIGLLVYEATFILLGFAIAHNWSKGRMQVYATWGVLGLSVFFMMANAILANYLDLVALGTANIPPVLAFYQFWIVPTAVIALGFLNTFVAFFDPASILQRNAEFQKVEVEKQKTQAEIAKSRAEADQVNIKLQMEADKATATADGKREEMKATKAQLVAETALKIQQIQLTTGTKQKIAQMRGDRLGAVLESKKFLARLNKEVDGDLDRIIDEYFETGDDPNA